MREGTQEDLYVLSFVPKSEEPLSFQPDILDDEFETLLPYSDPPYPQALSAPSIPWSFSTVHIPCANSVVLYAQDRTYLEYFSSSTTVYSMGKSYEWSNFRYLCQNIGSDKSVVMRSILALSASELYRAGKDNHELSLTKDEDLGLRYYRSALQELLIALSDLKSPTYSLESVLGAFYLLICYEAKFGTAVSNLKLHIEGARSYVESQIENIMTEAASSDTPVKSRLTPLCAQLLLWMA